MNKKLSTATSARRPRLIALAIVLAFSLLGDEAGADEASQVNKAAEASFNKEVLPILKKHCYKCHSHQAGKAKGGLVLDSRSGWSKGGDSGPALVPRDSEESLLMAAVRYKEDGLQMPPGGKLPKELIERLQRWIADGAHDPRVAKSVRIGETVDYQAGRQHWAFRPLGKISPPEVKNTTWPESDIDRYVLVKLNEKGLQPVEDADHFTWLRRVSFDLTGLPPSTGYVRAFTKDHSPQARDLVVDHMLASREFGERWARHWLDLVGYADQIGTSNSIFAEHAWRYRDYVIDAYRTDKPFDRFIREQIAGDLLPHKTAPERAANLTATGFLVLGDIEIVEADKAKQLVDIVDQQVNKTGKAFLGMTLGCARCHDHKYDPISQRDYYALGGFFHSTSSVYKTNRGVWSDVNALDLPETESQKKQRSQREKAHAEKLAGLKMRRNQAQQHKAELGKQLANKDLSKKERERFTKKLNKENSNIGHLNKQIEHAQFFTPTVPKVYGVRDVPDPRDMKITIRGNPRALGDIVPRGFMKVISTAPPKISPGQSGRRELADWIAGRDNPLTARVAVNRVWQKLFGQGLVRSVDYFGLPGQKPSHAELLDYLAGQFMKDGWSQKRLIRSIVLSRTYRLGSLHDEKAHAIDPDNRLLWRMNRIRLDAEALRDAMLFTGGRLQPSTGGPALPLEFIENVGGLNPKDVNPPNFRLNKWRPEQEFQRTIYLPVIRHAGQPGPATLRNVFDFPQPSEFTGQRAVTAVPTQALFLMNSPEVKKHATALAARMKKESTDEKERLKILWLTLLNRPITELEQIKATAFLTAAGENAWTELCHALFASNEFLMRI